MNDKNYKGGLKNMKVYLVFNKDGERVAIGNNKAIYTNKGHIKSSLTHQLKYYPKNKFKQKFGGFKVKEYELKETGKTFDIMDFIDIKED